MAKLNRMKMRSLSELNAEQRASIRTIGADLGDRHVHYAAVDGDGRVVAEGSIALRPEALQQLFGTVGRVRVVLEVGTHSPWVSRLIASLGHEVLVANPRRLPTISKSKKKSDRVDAVTLAKLGQADPDLLSPVRHRGEEVQRDLALLRSRDAVVKMRSRLVVVIRTMVKSAGGRLPKCSTEAFPVRVREHLPEALAPTLSPMVDLVATLTQQIRAMDKKIEELIKETYVEAQRFEVIKGVGPLTALAFVLLVEDPQRFDNSRNVGAYFGLVPRLYDSGDSAPQLRITKEGDVLMRRLLVTAAHYILGAFGETCDLRDHGLRIAARGGKNAKKRAVVAVARKLANLMHHLWVTGATYDPRFNAKRNAAVAAAA